MERRAFVVGGIAALAAPLAVCAQPLGKPIRVGWLSWATPERGPEHWRPGFERALRHFGWEPRFELRYAGGNADRLAAMARELTTWMVDVIVACDGASAQAAKQVTTTLPIVFVGHADPVGSGLIDSLARPGANITGGSSAFDEGIAGKWLELLREVRQVTSVGVIWDPAGPTAARRIAEVERAAAGSGVAIHRFPMRRPEDLEAFIQALARENIDGLIVDAELTLLRYNPRIAEISRAHRIPLVSPWRPFAEAGGAILAFGPSLPEAYRLAAVYVDKIVRGTKPATLPVQRVTKYDLIINLKTAKALGLTIPSSLLLRADQVIE